MMHSQDELAFSHDQALDNFLATSVVYFDMAECLSDRLVRHGRLALASGSRHLNLLREGGLAMTTQARQMAGSLIAGQANKAPRRLTVAAESATGS